MASMIATVAFFFPCSMQLIYLLGKPVMRLKATCVRPRARLNLLTFAPSIDSASKVGLRFLIPITLYFVLHWCKQCWHGMKSESVTVPLEWQEERLDPNACPVDL